MIQQTGKDNKIKVGITHGDVNSIAYEVIIKALNDNRLLEMFTPIIYGLSKVLSYNRKNLNFNDFNYKIIRDTRQVFNNKVNIINLSNEEVKIEFGKSTSAAGTYAFEALEKAVNDISKNEIDILVTAPINKTNIQSQQFDFPGHTEYLMNRAKTELALMLMVNGDLRIGTVTGHIPIKDVPALISEDLITEKLTILINSLIKDFSIGKPKIAILGLNPHAGDNGLLGDEDLHIIHPAIIKAKKRGQLVYGPFGADGFFGSDEYTKYDAILAMYHDQGLIPFKTLAFDKGVNYTAGLPFVRTSPAHGTAFDKAGKNMSSENAMREAIYLGIDIFRNRRKYQEMSKDPLKTGLLYESNHNNGRHSRESEEMGEVQG